MYMIDDNKMMIKMKWCKGGVLVWQMYNDAEYDNAEENVNTDAEYNK